MLCRQLMVHAKEVENSTDSPTRAAFMQIHEQLLAHEATEAAANAGVHTTRMLVAGAQASAIVGTNGNVVKAMQAQSATLINVKEAPPCAMPDDKVRPTLTEPSLIRSQAPSASPFHV